MSGSLRAQREIRESETSRREFVTSVRSVIGTRTPSPLSTSVLAMESPPGPSRPRSGSQTLGQSSEVYTSDDALRQRGEPPGYDIDEPPRKGASRSKVYGSDAGSDDGSEGDELNFSGGSDEGARDHHRSASGTSLDRFELGLDGDAGGLRPLATIEQKKALWWKNVTVTAIFIASW